ncbi:MAG: PaaI family thioesterase [Firmicutes bacterium]|nr:PaaI family thioesterase [Bacillota bacterium]
MKPLNPDHIAAIIDLINTSPYFSLLSLNVQKIELGSCTLEISLEEKHLNPFGSIHGGVYSSAIDTAAYWASYCSIHEDMGLISVDLHVDNISSVQSGKLTVVGKLIKAGRSVCFSEATVEDEKGKLLAHGTSKQLVINGLQTINHVLETMGHDALPPKFRD